MKWAFAFPGDIQAYSQPTIAGGRVFVGSPGGKVYSLDAKTGCVHWFFEAESGVRSAVTLARIGTSNIAFFGDGKANVYGVDAATGKQLWKTKADAFPVAGITSSPVFYNGRIYLGIRSGEEASGADPQYECCRFRGSVVALDAATGKQVWKTYMVDEPKRTTKNKAGAQLWAPSGVSVWSTSGHRRPAQCRLRHHRQQLYRSDHADERCICRAGSELGQDSLVAADDPEGRVHCRVPAAG